MRDKGGNRGEEVKRKERVKQRTFWKSDEDRKVVGSDFLESRDPGECFRLDRDGETRETRGASFQNDENCESLPQMRLAVLIGPLVSDWLDTKRRDSP